MALSDLLQVVLVKSDTVMMQQDVTRLTTPGCSNIVVIHDCKSFVGTTLQQV